MSPNETFMRKYRPRPWQHIRCRLLGHEFKSASTVGVEIVSTISRCTRCPRTRYGHDGPRSGRWSVDFWPTLWDFEWERRTGRPWDPAG